MSAAQANWAEARAIPGERSKMQRKESRTAARNGRVAGMGAFSGGCFGLGVLERRTDDASDGKDSPGPAAAGGGFLPNGT
jgi:hypothetical protein